MGVEHRAGFRQTPVDLRVQAGFGRAATAGFQGLALQVHAHQVGGAQFTLVGATGGDGQGLSVAPVGEIAATGWHPAARMKQRSRSDQIGGLLGKVIHVLALPKARQVRRGAECTDFG